MHHFLWTDIAFFIVLITGSVFVLMTLRQAPMRSAIRNAFAKPLAGCAGIVLCLFLIIGVLDSVHMSWTTSDSQMIVEIKNHGTLLDYLLSPLEKVYEKTYSTPLSLYSAAKETQIIGGQAVQFYPRLVYMSNVLKTNEDRNAFVAAGLLKAAVLSLGIWAGFLLLWVGLSRRFSERVHYLFKRKTWIIGLFLLSCIYALVVIYVLSRQLHVLGTGKIGEDILYYALKSIRTALIIGILTTLFMLPLAIFFGVAAGFMGGFVDDVIQYLYTTLSAVPGVLLISASILSMQIYIANHSDVFTTLDQTADARLLALCFILGVTSWTSLCRILRAEALKLREIDFVQAARALGSSYFIISIRHLIPNMMPVILITLALDFSFLVLAEAVLSYVGVGVSPTTMSFGNLINSARLELAREPVVWWPIAAAFVMMFALVLASNLVADAFREVFDPYGKKR